MMKLPDDMKLRHIYSWTDLRNGRMYIGQSKHVEKRLGQHVTKSKSVAPGHKPTALSEAMRGNLQFFESNIVCEVIGELDAEAAEIFFIEHFHAYLYQEGGGYNHTRGGRAYNGSYSKDQLGIWNQGRGRRYSDKTTSMFLGVRRRGKGQFCCYVNIEAGKTKERSFSTELEAATCYDRVVLHVYGPKAVINFEERREEFLTEDLEAFYNDYAYSGPKFPKTSIFNGIRRSYNGKLWMVQFVKKKKIPVRLVLGRFDDEISAAKMADKVMFYFGNDDEFNFPEDVETFDRDQLGVFFDSIVFKKKSKYKGVYLHGNRWTANYKENKELFLLGSYETEEEAHEVILKFIKDNNKHPYKPY